MKRASKEVHDSAWCCQKDQMFQARNGDRPEAKNIAILVTDGNANIKRNVTIQNAIDSRNQGIFVAAVGVGTQVDLFELDAIASIPTDRSVFVVTSSQDLANIRDSVVMTACNGKQ